MKIVGVYHLQAANACMIASQTETGDFIVVYVNAEGIRSERIFAFKTRERLETHIRKLTSQCGIKISIPLSGNSDVSFVIP